MKLFIAGIAIIFIVLLGLFIFYNDENQKVKNGSKGPKENSRIIEEIIPGTVCKAVVPEHNRIDNDRINLVFVGFNVDRSEFVNFLPNLVDYESEGYTTTFDFETKIKLESGETLRIPPGSERTFYGLLATEPFKSNKNKFNFWYVDEIIQDVNIPRDPVKAASLSCVVACKSDVEKTCGLKNIYTVNICNAECTPRGITGLKEAFIGNPHPAQIRIMIHELGHAFGLKDEYTLGNAFGLGRQGQDYPGYPNCAPSREIAEKWWGDLVGQGDDLLTVGYYQGCSYVEDNIKPTQASLMSANPGLGLGFVNERYIQELLNYFSGEYSDRIEERNMTAIIEEIENSRSL